MSLQRRRQRTPRSGRVGDDILAFEVALRRAPETNPIIFYEAPPVPILGCYRGSSEEGGEVHRAVASATKIVEEREMEMRVLGRTAKSQVMRPQPLPPWGRLLIIWECWG